nr:hypothetical protein [Streptomyces boncukensis]
MSVVLLLGVILFLMIRSGSLKGGPAFIAMLFGFFLASTGMAPSINRFFSSLADSISQINI